MLSRRGRRSDCGRAAAGGTARGRCAGCGTGAGAGEGERAAAQRTGGAPVAGLACATRSCPWPRSLDRAAACSRGAGGTGWVGAGRQAAVAAGPGGGKERRRRPPAAPAGCHKAGAQASAACSCTPAIPLRMAPHLAVARRGYEVAGIGPGGQAKRCCGRHRRGLAARRLEERHGVGHGVGQQAGAGRWLHGCASTGRAGGLREVAQPGGRGGLGGGGSGGGCTRSSRLGPPPAPANGPLRDAGRPGVRGAGSSGQEAETQVDRQCERGGPWPSLTRSRQHYDGALQRHPAGERGRGSLLLRRAPGLLGRRRRLGRLLLLQDICRHQLGWLRGRPGPRLRLHTANRFDWEQIG